MMEFLLDNGFDENIVKKLQKEIPEWEQIDLTNSKGLVEANLDFLKELGVKDYVEVFQAYYPMFLMDKSNFANVFNKYDKNDLLDKISKNMTIIEHL